MILKELLVAKAKKVRNRNAENNDWNFIRF